MAAPIYTGLYGCHYGFLYDNLVKKVDITFISMIGGKHEPKL